ncbi:MAG: hypothetical protein HY722_06865, partial [Planctomycetes bacterium]|nr:hypothetical protein [Planctomycetota bacterium]
MSDAEADAREMLRDASRRRELGDWVGAMEVLRRGLRRLRPAVTHPEAAALQRELARVYVATGDYARAILHFYRARDAGEAAGQAAEVARTLADLTRLYSEANQPAEARALAAVAFERARASGDAGCLMEVALASGRAAVEAGEWADARGRLAEAVEAARRLGEARALGEGLVGLAALHVRRGSPARARSALEEAAALLVRAGSRELAAEHALYTAAVDEDPVGTLGRALDLLRDLPLPHLVWRVHLALGRALWDRGDGAGAARHFVRSMEVIRRVWERVPPELGETYLREPDRVAAKEAVERLRADMAGADAAAAPTVATTSAPTLAARPAPVGPVDSPAKASPTSRAGADARHGGSGLDGLFLLGYHEAKEAFVREYLIRTLDRAGGSVTRAARHGGVMRQAFQRLLRQYGIRGRGGG